MDDNKIIAWWSAGVTSAVATKLAIDKYGVDRVEPIYFEIGSAHPDNERFKRECEDWYGKPIRTERSLLFKDQFDVIEKTKYFNGPSGARCTLELKKKVRFRIEKEEKHWGQVFGFEYSKKEINRALRFKEQYEVNPLFPLIEHKMTKPECLYFLEEQGILRPTMYTLGYPNNNCIMCVKGGMGYQNKIRQDFPDHFNRMMELENKYGNNCQKIPLRDLPPDKGRDQKIIMPDCGNFCEIEFTDIQHPRLDEVYETPDKL